MLSSFYKPKWHERKQDWAPCLALKEIGDILTEIVSRAAALLLAAVSSLHGVDK